MDISIVIPVFNEEGNIQMLAQSIHHVLGEQHQYELIFVDDGSTDQSLSVMRTLAQQNTYVRFLSFSRNFGHQAALKAGIDHATGRAVITIDADLQHPVALLPQMIQLWKEGYDVVYTKRGSEQDLSFFKKLTSSAFYAIIRILSDVSIENGTADFRLMDAKVANIIKQSNDSFLFIRGLIPWAGFKQYCLPYTPEKRWSGETKYSLRKMIGFALNGITGFSIKPLRMATVLGLVISLLSFIYGVYAVYVYFADDRVISGWASVLTSILFIGGIQLVILGIIGEYLGKMYLQTKNRPFYIIKEER